MKRGFTLTELLIVVTLVILLLILALVNWRRQIDRAYDAQRKTDLAKIKRAFEEYYNDHNCYPPITILNNCGGGELKPYLSAIPCDPQKKTPYLYVPQDDSNLCRGYRVLSGLSDTTDSDIAKVGCNGITGCGYGSLYNWGLSEGGSVPAPGFNPQATPTPTLAPPTGNYACAPGGFCNSYSDPEAAGCPVSFSDRDCLNQCSNPANWCQQ